MKRLIYFFAGIVLVSQIKVEARLFKKQRIDYAGLDEKQQGDSEHLKKLETTGQCTQCNLQGFDITKAYETYKSSQKESGQEIQPINVSGSNLSDSDLENGDFECGKFNGAILDSACCESANFKHAGLVGASFKDTQCQKAQFKEAYICKAKFINADCSHANFEYAHLEDVSFTNANLTATNLKYAYLYVLLNLGNKIDKTVFTGAKIQNAQFTGGAAYYLIKDAYNPDEAIFS